MDYSSIAKIACLLLALLFMFTIWPLDSSKGESSEESLPFDVEMDYWALSLLNYPEYNSCSLAESIKNYRWYQRMNLRYDETLLLIRHHNEVLYTTDDLCVVLKETLCQSSTLLIIFEISLTSEEKPFMISDLRQELIGRTGFPEGTLSVDLVVMISSKQYWYDSIGLSEDRKSIYLGYFLEYSQSDLTNDNEIEVRCNLLTGQFENSLWNDTTNSFIVLVQGMN